LEFPEVFARGGFDAVVGNPPFQGGKKISGTLGSDYREHLVEYIAEGKKGNADLVAYFFLRGAQVARAIGLLASDSIAQGDTREVGLDRLVEAGWTITRAVKSMTWPGGASVEIAKIWLSKEGWGGAYSLDNREVAGISTLLEPKRRVAGIPHKVAV